MVLEYTGKFLKVKELQPYFDKCGVERVVVSAPVKEPECLNVVLGCNHGLLTESQKLVTNQETFGIKHGCITTIHDVTGTQELSYSLVIDYYLLFVTCCLLLHLSVTHIYLYSLSISIFIDVS